MSRSEDPQVPPDASRRFVTTRWSLVQQAAAAPTGVGREALDRLCRDYWYPLYAYVRRRGWQPAEAQDATQEFLARLLARHALGQADPERGRFRTFLLAGLQNFLIDWQRAAARQCRGGQVGHLSLDFESAERRYALEPADPWTPDRLFQRRWAVTVLDRVYQRLEADYKRSGKHELYETLRPALAASADTPYQELAAELGRSVAAVKVAVHRMRRRFRKLLRDEIAQTVELPGEIEEEIRELFRAVRG
jgi:RNA polymerase sigma-70 factor (ECF subfamily)